MDAITINWPDDKDRLKDLQAGDLVSFSGPVFTARDQAHRRLVELLDAGWHAPFPLRGSAIFYAGPCPAAPGRLTGSIGPTTSGRMDAFKARLLQGGMKVMIGKGQCMPELADLCREHGAVYLAAPGGAAALIAQCVTASELVAWEDLGAEAVRRLVVKDLPLVVINDCAGRDYYRDCAGEVK